MNITSGKMHTAKKVVIYGTEGIGKSTIASCFPDPVFIDTEGSTKELDVKRFDKPTSWEMLQEQVRFTIRERPCKTLVIDTIDWAEAMCIDNLCSKHNKKGIEDFGYGNGYTYEKEEMGRFLNLLTDVVDTAGIHVVLTAHAVIRKFEQPDEMGAYDRYELKLGKKTTNQIAPLVKEWADLILFCNYKTFSIATDDQGKKHKAQGGQRVMYTTHHPCWDAKNRYGLPDEIPMDYSQIEHIFAEAAITSMHQRTAHRAMQPNPNLSTPSNIDNAIDSSPDVVPAPPTVTSQTIPQGIPKALIDLMATNSVSEMQIQKAVSSKGYFPADMPISDYPIDFINGVLIGAWQQVYNMIQSQDDLPF